MNKNILIVDDSSYFRTALGDILCSIGVSSVSEASSGSEMLTMLQQLDVDIVFIDIKLPGFSGIEATNIAHQRYPYLKIIGYSSMEDINYINSLIEAGACGFLSKNKNNVDLLKDIVEGKLTHNIFSKGLEINNRKEEEIKITNA